MDNIVRTFNVNVKYHSQLEKVGIDWSTDKFNRRYNSCLFLVKRRQMYKSV